MTHILLASAVMEAFYLYVYIKIIQNIKIKLNNKLKKTLSCLEGFRIW